MDMTTRYTAPSVEAIQEDSEDEGRDALRDMNDEQRNRQPLSPMDGVMSPTRANTGRERRRKHRSKERSSKHLPKSQARSTKRASGLPLRDSGSDSQRSRHRRIYLDRSASSASSSEADEGPIQDHREVLAAARAKLSSPSMLSTLTSLTTSTNKSSGSSGSNSTVTQASVTKRSSLGKRPELPKAPMSPAVPDPPNVFAFLDDGSTATLPKAVVEDEEGEAPELDENEEESDEENRPEQDEDLEEPESSWQTSGLPGSFDTSELPPHLTSGTDNLGASSSSSSSSFHGSDHFPEHAADNDTDRSTSPERSVKDHASDHEAESTSEGPTDKASARMASQMAAAQQRQHLYESMQNFGTPNVPRVPASLPQIHSTALSPRRVQYMQHTLPQGENFPITGYEQLATKLSSYNSLAELDDETPIRPMYRKFGALNHRLLLHLQDELSELEEQLHRLDNADTQSRRAGLSGRVVPASRRLAAMQGGDLQWHKTDVLGRIGFKLAQYNQALSSFNTTQSLAPPAPTDVEIYREYLSTEHLIAEAETHFLDPTEDLVSVCSSFPPYSAPISTQSSSSNSSSSSPSQPLSRSESQMSSSPPAPSKAESILTTSLESQSQLQGLAFAIAVAVLVPIITFSVIPGFVGRMTVVSLVAGGVVFALMQAGVVGTACLGKEGLVCGGIYAGVMVVIAGVLV